MKLKVTETKEVLYVMKFFSFLYERRRMRTKKKKIIISVLNKSVSVWRKKWFERIHTTLSTKFRDNNNIITSQNHITITTTTTKLKLQLTLHNPFLVLN